MITLDRAALERATRWLEAVRRPLLVSHTKPDGDALGALVGMREVLRARGVDARAVLFEPIPARYAMFDRFEPIPVRPKLRAEPSFDDRDAVIVLDTCTYNQLEPIADWLKATAIPKLAVDHHVTRDDLADAYLVDESAPAACLILHEWFRAESWSLPPQAAEALFIGVAMDTGWFRHSNTDARALRAATELTAAGVRPHEIHQRLYLQETPGRIRLLGAALSTLELIADGRLSVMSLSSSTIARAGATSADTEDIVNEPLRIGSTVVSVLLVEQGDGLVRINLRSKPPSKPGEPDVDVAGIAQGLGGGGHPRAAGARLQDALAAVRDRVIRDVQARIG